MAKSLKIAITGPPAAGKSTIARFLAQKGIPVFSADEEVHRLSRPCQPGYHAVLKRLGDKFLQEGGELDRKALLKEMLFNPEIKGLLEEIFHPLVKERLNEWFQRHGQAPVLVAEIPLLYQAGWEDLFDRVVFVTLEERRLKERLLKRLKDPLLVEKLLSLYQARPRPQDLVLPGDLSPEALEKRLREFFRDVTEEG